MNGRRLAIAATAIALAAVVHTLPARADSGEFNLHIEPSIGIPLAGEAADLPEGSTLPLALLGWVGFDWQLATPFAIEAMFHAGYWLPPSISDGMGGTLEVDGESAFGFGLGARYRFLDNQEGYGDEPTGDYDGNFWVSAHLGLAVIGDISQFAIDAGVGYEWSVIRPLSIGVFARGQLMLGHDACGETMGCENKIDFVLHGGLSFSLAFGGVEVLDTDGDGLGDEREVSQHQTDPNNPDTDGDALNDGLEVRTETNPRNADTDGDGGADGAEDANRSGGLDAGECDPRDNDSDDGGVPDGWEMSNPPHDCRNRADDDTDSDRVLDNVDQCPGTPANTEVDPRGCTILRAQMILTGINFEFNSAQINPNSQVTLQTAAQLLRDNPTATVEIGGHTDNVGSASYNRQLSQQRADSVRQWLIDNGIDANRMTTRGYGSTRPTASNDTEEGRAQNRRIEFRRTDSGASEEGQPVRREN